MSTARFRTKILASALTTVALLAAACGGGDVEDEGSGPTSAAGYNLTADQNRITTDEVESIAAKVPQQIRDRGTLVVTGSAGSAPPLRFYADDDKTLIGTETDFAYLIGDVLGLKVDLQAADWAQNFVRIDSGRPTPSSPTSPSPRNGRRSTTSRRTASTRSRSRRRRAAASRSRNPRTSRA